MYAAVACIRAAASRAGIPVRQACQDPRGPRPDRRPGPGALLRRTVTGNKVPVAEGQLAGFAGFPVGHPWLRAPALTHAAYDLRKLRGKNLPIKPGRSRRYQVPPGAARTITALLALRDHVIAPSSPGSAAPGRDADLPTGLASTATTRNCASACRRFSTTPASPHPQPPHRQHSVDPMRASWLGEIEHAADIATRMAAPAARTNSARTDTRLRFIAQT